MEIKVKNLTELIKLLSWQKIIQACLLGLILGTAWAIWENRLIIYNSIKVGAKVEIEEPLNIVISPDSQAYMDSIVNKPLSGIIGIQIVNVNFRKNTRSTAYFSIVDPGLKDEYRNFLTNKVTDIPLFTDGESNNQRLMNLINGEFVCNDYKDTIAMKLFPNAASKIPIVCSISIPPYYGRFSGYMNIYFTKRQSSDEMIYIKQLARDISLRVYENDVLVRNKIK